LADKNSQTFGVLGYMEDDNVLLDSEARSFLSKHHNMKTERTMQVAGYKKMGYAITAEGKVA